MVFLSENELAAAAAMEQINSGGKREDQARKKARSNFLFQFLFRLLHKSPTHNQGGPSHYNQGNQGNSSSKFPYSGDYNLCKVDIKLTIHKEL